jgi:hypothetical protein
MRKRIYLQKKTNRIKFDIKYYNTKLKVKAWVLKKNFFYSYYLFIGNKSGAASIKSWLSARRYTYKSV